MNEWMNELLTCIKIPEAYGLMNNTNIFHHFNVYVATTSVTEWSKWLWSLYLKEKLKFNGIVIYM
jgi:hypothetical protein